jgi:hypothetical protein
LPEFVVLDGETDVGRLGCSCGVVLHEADCAQVAAESGRRDAVVGGGGTGARRWCGFRSNTLPAMAVAQRVMRSMVVWGNRRGPLCGRRQRDPFSAAIVRP